jgi:hypothetical protein
MTLEWIPKELDVRVWNAFLRLRIPVGVSEHDKEPLSSIKCEDFLEKLSDCLIFNIGFAT